MYLLIDTSNSLKYWSFVQTEEGENRVIEDLTDAINEASELQESLIFDVDNNLIIETNGTQS